MKECMYSKRCHLLCLVASTQILNQMSWKKSGYVVKPTYRAHSVAPNGTLLVLLDGNHQLPVMLGIVAEQQPIEILHQFLHPIMAYN